MNNLKQAGLAIYMYAEDNDDALMTSILPSTIAQRYAYGPTLADIHLINNGEYGYVENYMGDDDDAYFCPASQFPDVFGTDPSQIVINRAALTHILLHGGVVLELFPKTMHLFLIA